MERGYLLVDQVSNEVRPGDDVGYAEGSDGPILFSDQLVEIVHLSLGQEDGYSAVPSLAGWFGLRGHGDLFLATGVDWMSLVTGWVGRQYLDGLEFRLLALVPLHEDLGP